MFFHEPGRAYNFSVGFGHKYKSALVNYFTFRIIQDHEVMTFCEMKLIQPFKVQLLEIRMVFITVWNDFYIHFSKFKKRETRLRKKIPGIIYQIDEGKVYQIFELHI